MIDHFWTLVVTLIGAFISFASGMPFKAFRAVRNTYASRIARKRISAGLFDDQALADAMRFYIRPMYSSIDPAVMSEPHQALVNARSDLFNMVDRFLREGSIRHLLVFADSGMGKTSFVLNYFCERHRAMSRRGIELRIIPLSSRCVDDLISDLVTSERQNIVLLLDALDEDPKARGQAEERLQELIRMAEGYKAIVVTCRTQFFKSDTRIPAATGLMRPGVVKAGFSKEYEFQKVYISPFDEQQVKKYLKKRYPSLFGWRDRARAMAVVNRVPLLSVRPMLLAHIPELLENGAVIDQPVDVYKVMVDAWAERESAWIPRDKLIGFSSVLAMRMYIEREQYGGEFITPEQIDGQAAEHSAQELLEHFSSRSLLNRRSDGVLKFAHRSIMEYFVARALVQDEGGTSMDVTDQMAKFIMQLCGCSDYSSEQLVTSKRVRVDILDAMRRLGYCVNYSLYFSVAEPIIPAGVVILPVRSEGELNEVSFGDYLRQVAVSRGGAFWINEVRIRCDGMKEGEVVAYVSVWMEGVGQAHFEKIYIRNVALRSVVIGDRYSECDFDVVGRAQGSRGIENLAWRLEVKSDLGGISPVGDNMQALHRNASAGFRYDSLSDVVTINLIGGGAEAYNEYGVVVDDAVNYSKGRSSFVLRGFQSK